MLQKLPCLFLSLIIVITGCASYTPAEKAALERAKSLNMPAEVNAISNPSILVPSRQVKVAEIDNKPASEFALPNSKAMALTPGRHALIVRYNFNFGISTVASTTKPGTFDRNEITTYQQKEDLFDFAPNTHYSLNSIKSGEQTFLVFEPITDAAALSEVNQYLSEYNLMIENKKSVLAAAKANLESYSAFSKENPTYLEGRWLNSENESEIEFRGNNFKFIGPKYWLVSYRLRGQGTFSFDQNSLTVNWSPNQYSEAWIYQKNGDKLVIKMGSLLSRMPIFGDYEKVK
jgi:hypothetical protein